MLTETLQNGPLLRLTCDRAFVASLPLPGATQASHSLWFTPPSPETGLPTAGEKAWLTRTCSTGPGHSCCHYEQLNPSNSEHTEDQRIRPSGFCYPRSSHSTDQRALWRPEQAGSTPHGQAQASRTTRIPGNRAHSGARYERQQPGPAASEPRSSTCTAGPLGFVLNLTAPGSRLPWPTTP